MKKNKAINDIFLLSQARLLADEATDNTVGKTIQMLLKNFLAMNVEIPKPISELKVEYFTGNNKKFPGISHICMDIDNKVAVATSGHVLLINPDEFVEIKGHNKGCIVVDKQKNIVNNATFPDYKKLIPNDKSTRPLSLMGIENIIFEARKAMIESKLTNEDLPIVKIGDKSDNKCDIFIAVSKLPYLMAGGADGWKAVIGTKSYLSNALVKRFDDGKILLIMPAQPASK